MLSVNSVCNAILEETHRMKIDMTPFKLQRILYLLYMYTLLYPYADGSKIFDAVFHKWQYGPVCKQVYEKFACFGENRIIYFAPNGKGEFMFPVRNNVNNKIFFECLYKILYHYGKMDTKRFVKIVTKQCKAWKIAENDKLLDDELIKEDAYNLFGLEK